MQESVRRRVFPVVLVLTLAFLGLYSFGVYKAYQSIDPGSTESVGNGDQLAIVDTQVLFSATLFGLSIFAVLFLGTVGYAAVGTILAGVAANTTMREVLLPVLLFPVSVPIVIGAAEATRLLFDENPDTGPGIWIRVLLVFALVFLAPIAYSIYLSLFRTQMVGGTQFVGVENYVRAFSDPQFWSGVSRVGLFLLQAGLPYSNSDIAIVMDTTLTDVPERYQDKERAQQLVATVADAVPRNGIVIVPAKEWEVQDRVRDSGCLVAIFAPDANVTRRDRKVARAVAMVVDGEIVIQARGETTRHGVLRENVSASAQAAGALAAYTLNELQPHVAPASQSSV